MYWQPPKQALTKVKDLVFDPKISRYGADEGIPELRDALMQKVKILYLENEAFTYIVGIKALLLFGYLYKSIQ